MKKRLLAIILIATLGVGMFGGMSKTVSAATTNDMWRVYNPNSGEHLYTSDRGEADHLSSIGWSFEDKAWDAPEKSGTPVYRLYNPNSGEHHYTTNAVERDSLTPIGWQYEGIGWYSDEGKGVPLYRLYNPNATGQYEAGAHHYTANVIERDHLISIGWNDEGIGWYGVDVNASSEAEPSATPSEPSASPSDSTVPNTPSESGEPSVSEETKEAFYKYFYNGPGWHNYYMNEWVQADYIWRAYPDRIELEPAPGTDCEDPNEGYWTNTYDSIGRFCWYPNYGDDGKTIAEDGWHNLLKYPGEWVNVYHTAGHWHNYWGDGDWWTWYSNETDETKKATSGYWDHEGYWENTYYDAVYDNIYIENGQVDYSKSTWH